MNIETILHQIVLSKKRNDAVNDAVNDGVNRTGKGVNDGTIYVKTNELSQATIDQLIQMGYRVKHFQFEYTQISL